MPNDAREPSIDRALSVHVASLDALQIGIVSFVEGYPPFANVAAREALGDPGSSAKEFVARLLPSLPMIGPHCVVDADVIREGRTLRIRGRPVDRERWVATVVDATQSDRRERDHERRADSDPLTGLLNRSGFEKATGSVLARGIGFALLIVDLDGFKGVNDTMGHAAGDEVLRVVSRRLTDLSGPRASVARLGGDEFALLVPDASEEDADHLAISIRDGVRARIPVGTTSAMVGCSVGLALHPRDGIGERDLTAIADRRMYAAKTAGRSDRRVGP